VCASLIKDFADLRDPVTGERLPTYAARREDLYQGPHVDEAPDVVTFVDSGRYMVDVQPTRRVFSRADWLSGTGSHRSDGVLIGWGPSFASGRRIEGAEIIDMTPTVLYHQGLPIPRYMDGKVLEALYSQDYRKVHLPSYSSDGRLEDGDPAEGALSSDDAARVEARLKGLGYM
jgi:predicted AlkP superfamily phosphohydrolase/phosphomutase